MRASTIFAATLAAVLAFGTAMGSARAEGGVVLQPKQLSVKQRNELEAAIGKARLADPAPFKRLERLPAAVAKLDRERRGRLASVSRQLWQLGKPAFLPMLEMLAVKGPARGKLTDSAWATLRVGLIETVGMHRDPLAVPVLDAILEKETDAVLVRAAAEALARIGDDASAQKLAYLATTSGPKQSAVLSAIGDCRRSVAAQSLADFARAPSDRATTQLTLKALGGMGNAWAWKTPAVAKTGEEAAVRGVAAKALVDAFARHEDAELRLTAQKALLLVDDPSTPALIEAAKGGANAQTRAALEALAQKVAHSPLGKH